MSHEVSQSDGGNPLTEPLVPYIPLSAMPYALRHEPLTEIDWRSLSPEMREPLLDLQEQHFAPTGLAVEIAMSIQNAVRSSLDRRNPLSAAERKRINLLSLQGALDDSQALVALSNPANGGIVAAETGLGKTTILRQALKLIAPQQTFKHGRSETCGWSKLKQVLYLHIDFPSNGTRWALIQRLAGGLDAILGTDYASKCLRLRNVDAALAFVMSLLAQHRVGLVVVDEVQEDSFASSPLRWEFARFFLSLLNLGIPIVLCGHPAAFEVLGQVAQVMRRFSGIGYFKLDRAKSQSEPWWEKAFVRGAMRFNLCDTSPDKDVIATGAQVVSAGVPGIFVKLYLEAQRIALRRGGTSVALSASDFQRACNSPRTIQLIKMAQWLSGATSNTGYADLSREPPQKNNAATSGKTTASRVPHSPDVASIVTKLRRADKQDRNRSAKRDSKNEELLKNLSADDIRVVERSLANLAALEEHQAQLTLEAKSPKP